MLEMSVPPLATKESSAPERELEVHRPAITGYCYRMLGSPHDAEDAVQETFVRAWRKREQFEGRSALRSWLYSIATNVCLDMLNGRARRARPMDLGAPGAPETANLNVLSEATWIEPIPYGTADAEGDPAELAATRETIRLAFIAALQHLPPRQRAALILCEVLHWKASETAALLDMSVPAVNSALQRARATLESAGISSEQSSATVAEEDRDLVARYVEAFERYDMESLTALIREDAQQSMPPYDLWLAGREDILEWWFGPGIGCRGSRLVATTPANGSVTFGQYKPSETGGGFDPWALHVVELSGGQVAEMTFFLDTERLFPLFGLPGRLEA